MKNKTYLSIIHTHEKQILMIIVLFAFVIRMFSLVCLESYKISSDNSFYGFGFETGRVARAIASGDGFSSPFEIGNFSTAWVAPIYPYILAVVFNVFGIYSQGSAFTILLLNSLFSSITCIFVYYIARNVTSERVGFLSAIIFAIYPPAIWHSINTIWNTTLSTLLIAVLIYYVLINIKKLNYRRSIVCGTIMGITALTNPGVMAFYPFCLFWLYSKLRGSVQNVSTYITVIILSFMVIISPWVIRNYLVFDKFIPVKSNLGMELRLGNNPNADGTFTMKGGVTLHPTLSKKEMARFKELREIGYVEYSSREARDYIFKNPLKVSFLTVKRFYLFWLGDLLKENEWEGNVKNVEKLQALKKVFYILPVPFLVFGIIMAWRNKMDISVFMYLLLSYPLTYYITHVSNRYRHPIEPFILIIGAYGIIVICDKLREFINKLWKRLNDPFQKRRFEDLDSNTCFYESNLKMVKIDWHKVKVVIFDVDGTLYDQRKLRKYMLMALLKYYIVNPLRLKELKILIDFRSEREKKAFKAVNDLENAQYIWGAQASGVSPEMVSSVVEKWILRVPLKYISYCCYPGVLEFFENLCKRGVATAILSDYPAKEKMSALGLSPNYIVCATDKIVDRFKPDPKGLVVITEKLGVSVEDCIFIGDRDERDGECARKAGMPYLIIKRRGTRTNCQFQSYHELNEQLNGIM